jgi:hypothetical protein
MFVSVERQTLAEDLWEYGEEDLAHEALRLSDMDLARVGVLAGRILLSDDEAGPSGASPMLAKACALAAVQVIEGDRRPLARRRRRTREQDRRSRPAPATAATASDEQPRQVYLAACEAIARHFEDRGFRFAKSGPHMSRRSDAFRFVVSFGPSRYNAAGVTVTLVVYAHVHSATLGSWRKARNLPGDDYLAAGNLGNLRQEHAWLDWDVGQPETRDDVIADVVAAIQSIAMPYFAHFEGEEKLVELLESGGMPGCAGLSPIEWLLATGREASAVRHGRALFATEEWLPRSYQREVKRYQAEGTDRGPYTGLAEGLAYATVAFGLNFDAF